MNVPPCRARNKTKQNQNSRQLQLGSIGEVGTNSVDGVLGSRELDVPLEHVLVDGADRYPRHRVRFDLAVLLSPGLAPPDTWLSRASVVHTRAIRFAAWAIVEELEVGSVVREGWGIGLDLSYGAVVWGVDVDRAESSELCHRNGGADPWHAHVIMRLNTNLVIRYSRSFTWALFIRRMGEDAVGRADNMDQAKVDWWVYMYVCTAIKNYTHNACT